MLWEFRNLVVPQARRRPHVPHESHPQPLHRKLMRSHGKVVLHSLRFVRVRHGLIARRAAPFVFVDSQQSGVRLGKILLFHNVAPFEVLQHAESLAVWATMEVLLTLGLHDLGITDDASVRRVGVVHRLSFGRGSELALWWVIQLEQNIKLRRGNGVDRSLGLLLVLLDRGVEFEWNVVVLGQFGDLGLDLARTVDLVRAVDLARTVGIA